MGDSRLTSPWDPLALRREVPLPLSFCGAPPAQAEGKVGVFSAPGSSNASGEFLPLLLSPGFSPTGGSSQCPSLSISQSLLKFMSAGGAPQKERQWNFPQQSRGVPRRGEPAVRQPSPSGSERQSDSTGVPSKHFHFIATNSWFI